MKPENTMDHQSHDVNGAVYLGSLFIGWIISNFTLNNLIGIVTLIGGCVYASNQALTLWKNWKNRNK